MLKLRAITLLTVFLTTAFFTTVTSADSLKLGKVQEVGHRILCERLEGRDSLSAAENEAKADELTITNFDDRGWFYKSDFALTYHGTKSKYQLEHPIHKDSLWIQVFQDSSGKEIGASVQHHRVINEKDLLLSHATYSSRDEGCLRTDFRKYEYDVAGSMTYEFKETSTGVVTTELNPKVMTMGELRAASGRLGFQEEFKTLLGILGVTGINYNSIELREHMQRPTLAREFQIREAVEDVLREYRGKEALLKRAEAGGDKVRYHEIRKEMLFLLRKRNRLECELFGVKGEILDFEEGDCRPFDYDLDFHANGGVSLLEHETLVADVAIRGKEGLKPVPKVGILPVREEHVSEKTLDVLSAQGVKVVNLSFTTRTNRICGILEKYPDMIFVVAAGNFPRHENESWDSRKMRRNLDQTKSYPSSCENANIISVASVDVDNKLALDSGRGKNTVTIAAPADGIYAMSASPDRGRLKVSGTSFGSPSVGFTVAAIKEVHPDADFDEIIEILGKWVHKTPELMENTKLGGVLDIERSYQDAVERGYQAIDRKNRQVGESGSDPKVNLADRKPVSAVPIQLGKNPGKKKAFQGSVPIRLGPRVDSKKEEKESVHGYIFLN